MLHNKWTTVCGVAGALLLGGAVLIGGAQQSSAQKKEFAWPKFFNVITPAVGTANHSLALAWTPEFNNATGSRARVLPAPNGYARTEWLNSGEGRLSLYQPSDYFDQLDAIEGYASRIGGPSDTRLINMNLVTAWGYMVRGDSSIKTIDDIKPGTKVALAATSSFLVAGVDALLAYRGLKRSDVQLVEVGSYGANTSVVAELSGRSGTERHPLAGAPVTRQESGGFRPLSQAPAGLHREEDDSRREIVDRHSDGPRLSIQPRAGERRSGIRIPAREVDG
jgi:hypothetical protein